VRPENLVLGVVGDVDPDAVATRLGVGFGGLDATGFEAPSPAPEPAPREIRVAELRKDRAQAHLVLGFRGLTLHDPDRHALEIVAQLLAGQGGRLFLELRDRQGLAYAVNAMNVEGMAPGFFTTYIATAPENLEAAKQGMLLELGKLLEEGPDADELDRARRFLVGNAAIDDQRATVRAAHVAQDALYGLGPDDDRRYAERILAVGRDDVLRASRRVIDLSAYTLAVIRP
jgi:zinc protease